MLNPIVSQHAQQIKALAEKYGLVNVRVFGSAAIQHSTPNDIDLLVDSDKQTSLLDLGAMQFESQELLGMPVDLLTPGDIPERFRADVLREAQAL